MTIIDRMFRKAGQKNEEGVNPPAENNGTPPAATGGEGENNNPPHDPPHENGEVDNPPSDATGEGSQVAGGEGEGTPPAEGQGTPPGTTPPVDNGGTDDVDELATVTGQRDDYAKRLHAALVAADGRLSTPDALPFDAGHLEDDGVTTAIDALLASNPALKAQQVAGDVGAGTRGADNAPAFDLIELMR